MKIVQKNKKIIEEKSEKHRTFFKNVVSLQKIKKFGNVYR